MKQKIKLTKLEKVNYCFHFMYMRQIMTISHYVHVCVFVV